MNKEDIKKEIATTVENYLRNFIEEEKKRIWSSLCMCEPDFNKLLQIQARAKAIDDLEKKILSDKI